MTNLFHCCFGVCVFSVFVCLLQFIKVRSGNDFSFWREWFLKYCFELTHHMTGRSYSCCYCVFEGLLLTSLKRNVNFKYKSKTIRWKVCTHTHTHSNKYFCKMMFHVVFHVCYNFISMIYFWGKTILFGYHYKICFWW